MTRHIPLFYYILSKFNHIKWCIKKRKIDNLYSEFSNFSKSGFSQKAFIRLQKIWNIQKSPCKLQETNESDIYIVHDCKLNILIKVTSLERASLLYSDGLFERTTRLANSYCLSQINFRKNDLVIDCGANYGDLFSWFKLQEIQIKYVGIEPSNMEYKCLEFNTKQYNCNSSDKYQLMNCALGDQNTNSIFYEDTSSASSSTLPVPNFKTKYIVKVKTLDSILDEYKFDAVKLLKLEAEGTEPEVCIGMHKSLPKIHYIAADLGWERGINQEVTAPYVINFLLKNGFVIENIGERHCFRILFRNESFPLS